MALVTFKIAGRPYKISCAPGQEQKIEQLAAFVDDKANGLLGSIGFIPEGQLLAMVSVLMAEELFRERAREKAADPHEAEQAIQVIDDLSTRICELAEKLS